MTDADMDDDARYGYGYVYARRRSRPPNGLGARGTGERSSHGSGGDGVACLDRGSAARPGLSCASSRAGRAVPLGRRAARGGRAARRRAPRSASRPPPASRCRAQRPPAAREARRAGAGPARSRHATRQGARSRRCPRRMAGTARPGLGDRPDRRPLLHREVKALPGALNFVDVLVFFALLLATMLVAPPASAARSGWRCRKSPSRRCASSRSWRTSSASTLRRR